MKGCLVREPEENMSYVAAALLLWNLFMKRMILPGRICVIGCWLFALDRFSAQNTQPHVADSVLACNGYLPAQHL